MSICFPLRPIKIPIFDMASDIKQSRCISVDWMFCARYCVTGKIPGILFYRTQCSCVNQNLALRHTRTHNRLTAVGSGLPGWAGARRNTHPLTPILVIGHPLSTSSIYYDKCKKLNSLKHLVRTTVAGSHN